VFIAGVFIMMRSMMVPKKNDVKIKDNALKNLSFLDALIFL
jgi:hypothetical protein